MSWESVNILGISSFLSRSHHSISLAILKNLASRGHNVTVFSYFKSKKNSQNYTDILIGDAAYQYTDSYLIDENFKLNGVINIMKTFKGTEFSACHQIFKLPQKEKMLEMKENSYSLIIAEKHYVPCYNLLAQELNIPLIIVYPTTVSNRLDHMIGNTRNPAVLPALSTSYSTHMSFLERV